MNNLFRNTGHVVASNGGAADGPLLRDERESKLFKADLGVVDAVGDEFFVSGSGEFSGRQRTGISAVGKVQVLAFVRGIGVVVLVGRVRRVGSALGRRKSRRHRQSREDDQKKGASRESDHGRELCQESVERRDCGRDVREMVVDGEKERFWENLGF